MVTHWFSLAFPLLVGLIADFAMSGWVGAAPALEGRLHRRVWWLPSLAVAAGAVLAAFSAGDTTFGGYAVFAAALALGSLWFGPSRARQLPPPKWVLDLRARTAPAADEMHYWRLWLLVSAVGIVAVAAAALL